MSKNDSNKSQTDFFILHMVNIQCLNHQTMAMIMIQMRRVKMETEIIYKLVLVTKINFFTNDENK